MHTYSGSSFCTFSVDWNLKQYCCGGREIIARRKTFEKGQKATNAESMHMWERDQ